MSIIYEALQKAQKQREAAAKPPLMARQKLSISPFKIMAFIVTLLVLTIIGLGTTYLIKHNPGIIFAPRILAKKQPPPAKPKIVRIVRLKLNGVFLSDDEKLAMINQQMYRLGDVIEGLKIVKIEMNTVLLENPKQTLELRV